jgi:hypothetical protein
MTIIENDSPKVIYQGPFQKGQLLPLTFPYIVKTDVQMMIDSTPAEINKDFEIITEVSAEHPVAYPNSVYLKNALPNAKQITLYRVTPLDQQAAFPQNSKFRSEHIERALDKLTMQQQEQEEQLARCVIAPITLKTFNGQLPEPAADQALKWNAEGTELENYDIIGEQEAFENDVNTRFTEQSTAFENRISEFEENTNAQFAGFRAEINENLEVVLDAASKLENLDNSVQAAENAASQANAAAARADEAVVAADQAVDEAESAADQAEEALTEVKEFIQNAEDEISQYYSLPMFTPIWSDHILNDASYLRADTFSWHNGEIFITAYNTLLAEFNSDKCVTETESGVTYKRTPSGFKIADIEQHENVLTTFTMTGKSWFYVLDTEQQRFKLPRTKFGFTGIRDTVGGDVDAGLPTLTAQSNGNHTHTRGTMNITGSFSPDQDCMSGARSGAFSFSNTTVTTAFRDHNSTNVNLGKTTWTFDASKSWTGATSSNGAHTHTITDSAGVLGKSNTVQPPATQMYLYFFIGNYARPQADIDIGELVEIVNNSDFEEQVSDGKAELNATKNNCIKEINSTGVGSRVLKTGDTMTGRLVIKTADNPALTYQCEKFDLTTNPDSTVSAGLMISDKAGTRISMLECQQMANGSKHTSINTMYTKADGTKAYASIQVGYDVNGNAYTYAPTPVAGDNSNKIATTAFVNNQLNNKIKSYITETYVNGTSGYRIWSDKFCEQWGRAKPAAANNGTTEVTLLKAYKNTNGMCLVTSPDITFMSGGGINYGTSSAKFIANNKIRVKQATGSPEDSNMQWYTTGYIA